MYLIIYLFIWRSRQDEARVPAEGRRHALGRRANVYIYIYIHNNKHDNYYYDYLYI